MIENNTNEYASNTGPCNVLIMIIVMQQMIKARNKGEKQAE